MQFLFTNETEQETFCYNTGVEINISTRVPWSVVLFNFLDIAIVTQIVELWLEVRKERVLVSQMPKVIQRLTKE